MTIQFHSLNDSCFFGFKNKMHEHFHLVQQTIDKLNKPSLEKIVLLLNTLYYYSYLVDQMCYSINYFELCVILIDKVSEWIKLRFSFAKTQ